LLLSVAPILKVAAISDDSVSERFRHAPATAGGENRRGTIPGFLTAGDGQWANSSLRRNRNGAFRTSAAQILQRNGIPNPESAAWYPQQAWLNAFREIAKTIGASTLHQIGLSIPRSRISTGDRHHREGPGIH
jgi:hypothetical protein